ncbi:hypothetical protein GCM10011321_38910 [Youhaiella tibetensis]|nr:CAP domain-containing protein [Youhaiella tibetensis]GGF44622.1 hypothetical protein GCM10011321_38910 [Youhaiella tibetensis]
MTLSTRVRPLGPVLAATLVAALLGACSFGGGGGGGSIAPGLVARMDTPGATLDKTASLGIVNQYRATAGAGPLRLDPGLDATAQALANEYARTGTAPKTPSGARTIRVSAGYANFAETFSGWRNSPDDARVLADPTLGRAGLGVAYDPNSGYGVYWVLVLAD